MYFLNVSTSRATFDIKDGKISPWLILNSKSGKELLKKLSDDQLDLISKVINPQFWLIKFKKHTEQTNLVKQLVLEMNL